MDHHHQEKEPSGASSTPPPPPIDSLMVGNRTTVASTTTTSSQDISHDGNNDDADDTAPSSSHNGNNHRTPPPPLHRRFFHRTKTLYSQLTTSEISGSLGDLGTLIPLVVAMARQRSIYLTPALFFAGLANVITGYMWDVPMCVQPMKSIAAVSLSENLSRETVTCAGILTGGLILVIGITHFIDLVNVIVPPNVVSGIQIGIGLRLAGRGIKSVQELSWVDDADCIILALVLSVMCLYWLREGKENNVTTASSLRRDEELRTTQGAITQYSQSSSTLWRRRIWNRLCCCLHPSPTKQHPVGVYLFLIGVIFAIIELSTTNNVDGQYDLPLRLFGSPVAVWAMADITGQDWKIGFLEGAVPQIPLTTLNSVISVCCLAHSLYPEKRNPKREVSGTNDAVISRRDVSVSVGLMNVIMCPFGAMPNCHGAGGLAGQHRLGARHGASVVFLGLNKIVLAIFFGSSVLTLLDALPVSVLGVMLSIAGQELATTGYTLLVSSVEEEERRVQQQKEAGGGGGTVVRSSSKKARLRKSVVISTITAMVTVALGKTHYGALSGWVAHMVYGDGTVNFVRWCRLKWAGRVNGRRRETTQLSTTSSSPATALDGSSENGAERGGTDASGFSHSTGSADSDGGGGDDEVEDGTCV